MTRNSMLMLMALLCLKQLYSQKCLLKVGDKAPPLKIFRWVKGNPEEKFAKGQVYIVEFGATWCGPCAAAIPGLTAIQKKYGPNISVIGLFVMELNTEPKTVKNPLYVKRVEEYVKKQAGRMDYHVAADGPGKDMENLWLKAAGLSGIPHTFIIDKNGFIAWIGNPTPEMLNRVVGLVESKDYDIKDAIEGSKIEAASEEARVDVTKPLFIDGNGGDGTDFLYRSMLTRYRGEKGGNIDFVYSRSYAGYSAAQQSYAGMVQQINASIGKLYYMAYADTLGYTVMTRYADGTPNYPDTLKYPMTRNSYGKYWYKCILRVKDTSVFESDHKSLKNKFIYSLIIPDKKATAKYLQEVMQRDLKSYFGYDVSVIDTMMPYWRVTASEKASMLLRTKTPGNKYKVTDINDSLYKVSNAIVKDIIVSNLIIPLSFGYKPYGMVPKQESPFIDETGITDEIDYEMTTGETNEINKGNWDAMLRFFKRIGLNIEKGERQTKVVIIRDPI